MRKNQNSQKWTITAFRRPDGETYGVRHPVGTTVTPEQAEAVYGKLRASASIRSNTIPTSTDEGRYVPGVSVKPGVSPRGRKGQVMLTPDEQAQESDRRAARVNELLSQRDTDQRALDMPFDFSQGFPDIRNLQNDRRQRKQRLGAAKSELQSLGVSPQQPQGNVLDRAAGLLMNRLAPVGTPQMDRLNDMSLASALRVAPPGDFWEVGSGGGMAGDIARTPGALGALQGFASGMLSPTNAAITLGSMGAGSLSPALRAGALRLSPTAYNNPALAPVVRGLSGAADAAALAPQLLGGYFAGQGVIGAGQSLADMETLRSDPEKYATNAALNTAMALLGLRGMRPSPRLGPEPVDSAQFYRPPFGPEVPPPPDIVDTMSYPSPTTPQITPPPRMLSGEVPFAWSGPRPAERPPQAAPPRPDWYVNNYGQAQTAPTPRPLVPGPVPPDWYVDSQGQAAKVPSGRSLPPTFRPRLNDTQSGKPTPAPITGSPAPREIASDPTYYVDQAGVTSRGNGNITRINAPIVPEVGPLDNPNYVPRRRSQAAPQSPTGQPLSPVPTPTPAPRSSGVGPPQAQQPSMPPAPGPPQTGSALPAPVPPRPGSVEYQSLSTVSELVELMQGALESPEAVRKGSVRRHYKSIQDALAPLQETLPALRNTRVTEQAATQVMALIDRLEAKYGDLSQFYPDSSADQIATPPAPAPTGPVAPVGTSPVSPPVARGRESSVQVEGDPFSDLPASPPAPNAPPPAAPSPLPNVPEVAQREEYTPPAAVDRTADHIYGSADVTYTPKNTEVRFRYALVPLDSLITSHVEDGGVYRENPGYDARLQNRDRERAGSLELISSIAGQLNPRRIMASPTTQDGAPIIGPDNYVEGGNARTLGLRKALTDPGKAAAYQAELESRASEFGLDPAEVQRLVAEGRQPVLVRVRQGALSPEERQALTEDMNDSTTQRLSPAEQAQTDASRLLRSGALELAKPNPEGDITTRANQPFVVRFMEKVVSATDRNTLINAKGELSPEGRRRIENALAAAAYPDPEFLELLMESDETRRVRSAIIATAPKMALLVDKIKKGERFDLDITKDIADAATVYAAVRRRGETIEAYLNPTTSSMFEEEAPIPLTQVGRELVNQMDAAKNSTKKLIDFLDSYIDVVNGAGNPKQLESGIVSQKSPPRPIEAVAAAKELAKNAGNTSFDLTEPTNEEDNGGEGGAGVLRPVQPSAPTGGSGSAVSERTGAARRRQQSQTATEAQPAAQPVRPARRTKAPQKAQQTEPGDAQSLVNAKGAADDSVTAILKKELGENKSLKLDRESDGAFIFPDGVMSGGTGLGDHNSTIAVAKIKAGKQVNRDADHLLPYLKKTGTVRVRTYKGTLNIHHYQTLTAQQRLTVLKLTDNFDPESVNFDVGFGKDRQSGSGLRDYRAAISRMESPQSLVKWMEGRVADGTGGNLYTPVSDLAAQAQKDLGLSKEQFGQALYRLQQELQQTGRANLVEFVTPSGNAKESDILTVQSDSGKTLRYYGVRMRPQTKQDLSAFRQMLSEKQSAGAAYAYLPEELIARAEARWNELEALFVEKFGPRSEGFSQVKNERSPLGAAIADRQSSLHANLVRIARDIMAREKGYKNAPDQSRTDASMERFESGFEPIPQILIDAPKDKASWMAQQGGSEWAGFAKPFTEAEQAFFDRAVEEGLLQVRINAAGQQEYRLASPRFASWADANWKGNEGALVKTKKQERRELAQQRQARVEALSKELAGKRVRWNGYSEKMDRIEWQPGTITDWDGFTLGVKLDDGRQVGATASMVEWEDGNPAPSEMATEAAAAQESLAERIKQALTEVSAGAGGGKSVSDIIEAITDAVIAKVKPLFPDVTRGELTARVSNYFLDNWAGIEKAHPESAAKMTHFASAFALADTMGRQIFPKVLAPLSADNTVRLQTYLVQDSIEQLRDDLTDAMRSNSLAIHQAEQTRDQHKADRDRIAADIAKKKKRIRTLEDRAAVKRHQKQSAASEVAELSTLRKTVTRLEHDREKAQMKMDGEQAGINRLEERNNGLLEHRQALTLLDDPITGNPLVTVNSDGTVKSDARLRAYLERAPGVQETIKLHKQLVEPILAENFIESGYEANGTKGKYSGTFVPKTAVDADGEPIGLPGSGGGLMTPKMRLGAVPGARSFTGKASDYMESYVEAHTLRFRGGYRANFERQMYQQWIDDGIAIAPDAKTPTGEAAIRRVNRDGKFPTAEGFFNGKWEPAREYVVRANATGSKVDRNLPTALWMPTRIFQEVEPLRDVYAPTVLSSYFENLTDNLIHAYMIGLPDTIFHSLALVGRLANAKNSLLPQIKGPGDLVSRAPYLRGLFSLKQVLPRQRNKTERERAERLAAKVGVMPSAYPIKITQKEPGSPVRNALSTVYEVTGIPLYGEDGVWINTMASLVEIVDEAYQSGSTLGADTPAGEEAFRREAQKMNTYISARRPILLKNIQNVFGGWVGTFYQTGMRNRVNFYQQPALYALALGIGAAAIRILIEKWAEEKGGRKGAKNARTILSLLDRTAEYPTRLPADMAAVKRQGGSNKEAAGKAAVDVLNWVYQPVMSGPIPSALHRYMDVYPTLTPRKPGEVPLSRRPGNDAGWMDWRRLLATLQEGVLPLSQQEPFSRILPEPLPDNWEEAGAGQGRRRTGAPGRRRISGRGR